MTDTRLIERWLPIAELGEERVHRSVTALPPTYYLHVWWRGGHWWFLGPQFLHRYC